MNFLPSLLLWILPVSAYAQAEEEGDEQPLPTLELLEFLGRWETDNGERIDPVELEEGLLEQPGWIVIGESNE